MVTFEVDSAAVAAAGRRGRGEVILPAVWLAGCLAGLLLLPVWAVPVLLPLALVFGLLAVAGLVRLGRTRRPGSDTLELTEDGVRYAGELVDWAHVRAVLAYPNTDRLEVRTGCPQPVDGAGCDHGPRGGRRWMLSAELFGTTLDALMYAFGRYVAVDEREVIPDERLRRLLGRQPR